MKASQLLTCQASANDAVTLDDILIFLGEFGWHQKYLFLLLTIFCVFLSFVYFAQTFLTVLPTEYWCKLPEVKGVAGDKVKEIMIPSAKLLPYEGHNLPYSRCWIYDLKPEQAMAAGKPDPSWPVKKCSSWEYKLSGADVPYMSVAAQENWVCDNAYKSTFAQSIFFAGSIVGGLFFGWMADKYGRVPVLIGTNMVGFLGGMSTIFASQFWQFLACRFVVGLAYDNTYVMAYILVLEYIGPQWRTFAANMSYGLFYTLGALSLPWMAYGIGDWKIFAIATSLPMAIVLLAPFFIPESARWLVSKGELEKAVKIISSIEKINQKEVPQDIYEDFLDDSVHTADTLGAERYSFVDLFRTRRMRNLTILLMVAWGVIRMSYDGHIRCLDTFGMDIFTTFTIASATELPADMFVNYTLDSWGRRWTLFGSVFLSGLFSLGAASAPVGLRYASFAIVGRLFINIASNISVQYAAELLPTVVRGEGLAFVHIIGYVTTIFSPFIAFSSNIMYNLPMIILGVACIGGGIICLFLPETLMQQLPQTMLDGELFGVEQSFWDNPFTKMRKPLEPRGHHLHAKRPASRPGMLRSSMISGNLGNATRWSTMRDRVSQMMVDGAASTATGDTSHPLEYLQTARQEYSGDDNVAT